MVFSVNKAKANSLYLAYLAKVWSLFWIEKDKRDRDDCIYVLTMEIDGPVSHCRMPWCRTGACVWDWTIVLLWRSRREDVISSKLTRLNVVGLSGERTHTPARRNWPSSWWLDTNASVVTMETRTRASAAAAAATQPAAFCVPTGRFLSACCTINCLTL